jgi:hypothetical protein
MCSPRAILSAFVMLVAGATGSEAQSDVQRLKQQYDALEARRVVAASALDSLRRAVARVLDDSIEAGGRRVRFVGEQMNETNREILTQTLIAERAWLESKFGAHAATLVDSSAWDIEQARAYRSFAPRLRRRTPTVVGLRLDYVTPAGAKRNVVFKLTIDTLGLQSVARAVAGERATQLHPTLQAYVRSGTTLGDAREPEARASQSLALAGSVRGRRCRQGSIEDCRVILAGPTDVSSFSVYFDESDHHEMVRRAAAPRPNASAAVKEDRERCLESRATDACAVAAQRVASRYPFRDVVRTSFAAHALMMGGAAGLDRLVAARGSYEDDPVGLLAHVADVPVDTLVAQWQARVAESGDLATRDPIAPVLFTTLAWSSLLLVAATARRPK